MRNLADESCESSSPVSHEDLPAACPGPWHLPESDPPHSYMLREYSEIEWKAPSPTSRTIAITPSTPTSVQVAGAMLVVIHTVRDVAERLVGEKRYQPVLGQPIINKELKDLLSEKQLPSRVEVWAPKKSIRVVRDIPELIVIVPENISSSAMIKVETIIAEQILLPLSKRHRAYLPMSILFSDGVDVGELKESYSQIV